MKTHRYILTDLLLFGLTLALMFLFHIVFYPTSLNNDPVNKGSVSAKNINEIYFQDYGSTKKSQPVTNQLIKESLTYMNAGDLDEALAACNKAVTTDSTDAKVYFLRAVIYTALNKNAEALKDYTLTMKLNPKHTQAYLNRGLLNAKESNTINAFVDYIQAIKISPFKSISFLITHLLPEIKYACFSAIKDV